MSSLPAGVTEQDLIDAQRFILTHSPIVPLSNSHLSQAVRHECKPTCVFHEHGSLMVCTHSNNVHFCSEGLCKHLYDDEEVQVCAITNKCYPLACVIPVQYECAKPVTVRVSAAAASADPIKCKTARHSSNAKNEAEMHNVLKTVLGAIRLSDPPGKTLYDVLPIEVIK